MLLVKLRVSLRERERDTKPSFLYSLGQRADGRERKENDGHGKPTGMPSPPDPPREPNNGRTGAAAAAAGLASSLSASEVVGNKEGS